MRRCKVRGIAEFKQRLTRSSVFGLCNGMVERTTGPPDVYGALAFLFKRSVIASSEQIAMAGGWR